MSTIHLTSNPPRAVVRRAAAARPTTQATAAQSMPFAVTSRAFERLQHGDRGVPRVAWLALPAAAVVLAAFVFVTTQRGGGTASQTSNLVAQPATPAASAPTMPQSPAAELAAAFAGAPAPAQHVAARAATAHRASAPTSAVTTRVTPTPSQAAPAPQVSAPAAMTSPAAEVAPAPAEAPLITAEPQAPTVSPAEPAPAQ